MAINQREQRFLDHLGVTAWHEAGYTGKRGLTASAEPVDGSGGSHANMTKKVFQLFAPDRETIYLSCAAKQMNGVYTSKFIDEGIPIIQERHVDTMWKSTSGITNGHVFDESLETVKDFFTFFAAAANDADEGYNRDLDSTWIYGVGAYQLMYPSNNMAPTFYSSESEYVDFAAPTLVYGFSGTSCACPVLCGMAAVVNDFFIDKTGKPLSSEKMYQFLKDCSVDIYEEGKDVKTGWGAPILPRPDKVDISKYAEVSTMYKDDAQISSWHKEDVYRAQELGLMQGDGDMFRPKDPVTREELASVIVRLHDQVTK